MLVCAHVRPLRSLFPAGPQRVKDGQILELLPHRVGGGWRNEGGTQGSVQGLHGAL
jgi:hypothetical protein